MWYVEMNIDNKILYVCKASKVRGTTVRRKQKIKIKCTNQTAKNMKNLLLFHHK